MNDEDFNKLLESVNLKGQPRLYSESLSVNPRPCSVLSTRRNWKIRGDRGKPKRYFFDMNDAVRTIEHAVEQLGRNDLAVFREWFSTFEAAEWKDGFPLFPSFDLLRSAVPLWPDQHFRITSRRS